MMDDGWWMMDDEWWMMNDEWWMMNDEWWIMNYAYDRVYVNGSDFWPKSQNLKENFLNK